MLGTPWHPVVGRGGVLEDFWWWLIGALWFEAPGDGQVRGRESFRKRGQLDQRLGGGEAGCRQ